MRIVLLATVLATLLPFAATAADGGQGLRWDNANPAWSTWQARLSVTSTLPLDSTRPNLTPPAARAALRLSSDRYFNLAPLGDGGGLRATTALWLGPKTVALGSAAAIGPEAWNISTGQSAALIDNSEQAATAMPYLGLGYSTWWRKLGLGISADVGVLAQRPGGASLGRLLSGSDSLDLTLRSMQLSPVFQLNLSYSF